MIKSQAISKSKLQLLLLALAFLVPILLAKTALTVGFKGEVKTHGGQLLNIDNTYQQLIGNNKLEEKTKQWRIVYVSPNACDAKCLDGLFHMQQTYKALGRLQERVSLDLLSTHERHQGAVREDLAMNLFSHHVVHHVSQEVLNNKVVIVDPMGNLVMSYQFDSKPKENLIKAHDMLLDIKQLLKLSRIG